MTEIEINLDSIIKDIENLRIWIDPSLCNGCGTCGEVCPFGLPLPDGTGKYQIKRHDLCTDCSACKRNCPTQAIIMNEIKGCGCLWDARARKKSNSTNVESNSCGCSSTTNNNSSCCG